MMLIRIPMLSEVKDVVRLADISLNSEFEVIKALNEEARRQGKLHKVILMADLGDLREGFWDKDELVDVAEYIEDKMINIQLVGVVNQRRMLRFDLPYGGKTQRAGGSRRKSRGKTGP